MRSYYVLNICVGVVIAVVEVVHFVQQSEHAPADDHEADTHEEASDDHGVAELLLIGTTVLVFTAADAVALFVHLRRNITDRLTKHHLYNMTSLLVLVIYNTVVDFVSFFDDHLRVFATVRTVLTLASLLAILAFIKRASKGSAIRIANTPTQTTSAKASSVESSARDSSEDSSA